MSLGARVDAPVLIPHSELSQDTLQRLIESFVLREGTEYGEQEVTLAAKVAQVLRQLRDRQAHILFDPPSESVQIVLSRDLPAGLAQATDRSIPGNFPTC